MNNKLKSYLLIIVHVAVGLIVLIFVQELKLPIRLNSSIIVFLAFLFLNLIDLYIFRLTKELKEFWTLRKIGFLFFGLIGGILIALAPTTIGLLIGQLNPSEINFDLKISIGSFALTFVIIAWEELWFRGLFLNYCRRYLRPINLSLTIGFLFMLIHLLNPKIDLLRAGPALFFAGAFLTILYFYFKTIWLPVGLHLGNNLTGTILKTNYEMDPMFGNEGSIGALLLAGLFFYYCIKSSAIE